MTPSTPSVRAIVARHAEAAADNRVFFHPDIPEHRLAEALRGYPAVKAEDVLVLLDNTDSGSADEGALLTEDTLHVRDHGQPSRRFPLDRPATVALEPGPPRVLEIDGRAVLKHLRVRPETIERFVAMLSEIARTAASPAGAPGNRTPDLSVEPSPTATPQTANGE